MKNIFLSLAAGIVLFASACGSSSEAPAPSPEEKPGVERVASLKVMSYNIHHCNPPSKANVIDVGAIVNVINAEKPDLVALQEVDVNTQRSGVSLNQAAEIATRLRMSYYFGKAIDYQGGGYGVAILSKYPLSQTVVHRLPTLPGSGGEARVLATGIVTLPDGTQLRFGSTHLDALSDPANRQAQVDQINSIASNESLPFIIAGDFNAVNGSAIINTLDQRFQRTCSGYCAPTIPVNNPSRAIDFIAYRHPLNKFSTGSHKVIDERYASDHLPVVAVISIAE